MWIRWTTKACSEPCGRTHLAWFGSFDQHVAWNNMSNMEMSFHLGQGPLFGLILVDDFYWVRFGGWNLKLDIWWPYINNSDSSIGSKPSVKLNLYLLYISFCFVAGFRFYTTGWLASGSNLLNLLRHIERWIMTPGTVQVLYDRPV